MKTSNALKILDRLTGPDAEMRRAIARERANLAIAQQVFDLRSKAGLSQRELAEKLGTTQSVVSRLEDSSYAGHSLTMLQRVAAVLNQRLEIRFVPARRKALQAV